MVRLGAAKGQVVHLCVLPQSEDAEYRIMKIVTTYQSNVDGDILNSVS